MLALNGTLTHRTAQESYFNVSLMLPIDDINIEKRLYRANDIVNGFGYTIKSNGTEKYTIAKASTSLLEDNSVQYTVDTVAKSCTCPDYPTARGGLCKHRIAVMIVQEMVRE